ncbi:MAG: TrkA family potassium uptake protein [Dehalococcoidia bacterium]|nr:TrkA family potassium uptake protein [Dehalococcoidia bacterium]
MYFVIAGLSSIGKSLVEVLQQAGEEVVAIDSDKEKCSELAESSDIMVIEGDITKKAVLEEAGVKNAKAMIALTNDDSDNLMACMLAKEIGAKKVISILNDIVHAEAFKEARIDIQVKPDTIVAKHIYHTILQPYVKDFVSINNSELFDVEIEENMKCVGKNIRELETPKGVKILWVKRKDTYLSEEDTLAPGDHLTLIVKGEFSKRGTEFIHKCFTQG